MKIFCFKRVSIFLLFFLFTIQVKGIEINVNLSPPEQNKLQEAYSKAYGFTQAQVAPLIAGPATEIPLVLQIAKNAGTVPLEVWMMRKMRMSYTNILQHYGLLPTVLIAPGVSYDRFGSLLQPVVTYQQKYKDKWPSTVVLSDSSLIELAKIKHFTRYAKIPALQIVSLPSDPIQFSHLVLEPKKSSSYFLPPGQAKKHAREMLEEDKHGHKKQKWEEGYSFLKKKYENEDDDDDKGEKGHRHGKWKD